MVNSCKKTLNNKLKTKTDLFLLLRNKEVTLGLIAY